MRNWVIPGLVIMVLFFISVDALWAKDTSMNHGKERILGGHAYLPSIYVTDPWVASLFQNFTGGGMAMGLKTPFYNLDGEEIFILEGDLFYASLGLGYQQRLGSKFAVGAKFNALVRTGTNAQTLIAEGANVDRNMDLWFKYRVWRGEKSQFTIGLDWEYSKTFVIDPAGFARAIIDGADLDDAPLLSEVKNWTARLALNYAHAFNPTFAFRANGQFGLYEVPYTSDVSKATSRLGVLFEADLKPKLRFPLGFTLGYTLGFPDDDPGSGLSGTLFGLWFTGQEAFIVGVETGYMNLPVLESDEEVDALFGLFTISYFF